jgi:hypothetical protein
MIEKDISKITAPSENGGHIPKDLVNMSSTGRVFSMKDSEIEEFLNLLKLETIENKSYALSSVCGNDSTFETINRIAKEISRMEYDPYIVFPFLENTYWIKNSIKYRTLVIDLAVKNGATEAVSNLL